MPECNDKDTLSNKRKQNLTLATCALAIVLFALISSPAVYNIVNGLLGGIVKIANADGCPTVAGLAIHSLVFVLIFGLIFYYAVLKM